MPLLSMFVQTLSISVSLLAAGSIATFSLFDVPELQAQPASRSLPSIRWLFSRGSHIFPPASFISSAGFAYLAFSHFPATRLRSIEDLLNSLTELRCTGFIIASMLTFSIAPFTTFIMIPNNFALIEVNEKKGGSRSSEAANSRHTTGRTAEESVNSKGEAASEFTDLSGPQTRTKKESTVAEDQEVRQMLGKFGAQNFMRAVLMGSGGLVGLVAASM